MPVLFSIATIEARGPEANGSQLRMAVVAASWTLVSSVVLTVSPPVKARRAPSWPPPSLSTTCCFTQEVKYGYVVARLVDQALVEHPVEHDGAAPASLRGVGDRVEAAGRGDHAGQQRRLVQLELRRARARLVLLAARVVMAEVGLRRRLDAVGAVAEVDRVEVVAQDPLLGPLARELVGQRGLAQLHEQRAVVLGGERVLDELLRDRRAALHHALVDDVLPQGAADAAQVVALVGVEAAVLDRDDRLLQDRGDLGL